MVSGFATFLRSEIDARGWTDRQMATNAGINPSTLHNWLTNPNVKPELDHLAGVAEALQVPLVRLIAICGYDVGTNGGGSNPVAATVAAVPELRAHVEELMQLSPEDQRAVRAFVQALQNQKRRD
jgi:transcriptional regulator with XRE-family HTH domain